MKIVTLSILLVMEVLVTAVGVSTSATGTSSITDRIDGPTRIAFDSPEKLTDIPFIINRADICASEVTLQHSLSCCACGSSIANSPFERSAGKPPCVRGRIGTHS